MNHRGGVKSRRSSQTSLRNSRSTFRRSPRGTEEQGLSGNSHAFQTLSYGPIQPFSKRLICRAVIGREEFAQAITVYINPNLGITTSGRAPTMNEAKEHFLRKRLHRTC